MGLYLCVFDDSGDELEGVDIGLYADFNFFRDAVTRVVENNSPGTVCPVLIQHSDCDGEWTSEEAKRLLIELDNVAEAMGNCPPDEFNSEWKSLVAQTVGISPGTLLECFFDVDGEPLVERLQQLARASISSGCPILFQ